MLGFGGFGAIGIHAFAHATSHALSNPNADWISTAFMIPFTVLLPLAALGAAWIFFKILLVPAATLHPLSAAPTNPTMTMDPHRNDTARAAPATRCAAPGIDIPMQIAQIDQDAGAWQVRFAAPRAAANPVMLSALAGIALVFAWATRLDDGWRPAIFCAAAALCLLAMLHYATRMQTVRIAQGWLTHQRASLLLRRVTRIPLNEVTGFSPARATTLDGVAGRTTHFRINADMRFAGRRCVTPALPDAEVAGALAAQLTYALHSVPKQNAGDAPALRDPYAKWRVLAWLVLSVTLSCAAYLFALFS